MHVNPLSFISTQVLHPLPSADN